MHSTLDFLLRHGYVVLLGWVFAEQIGLPVPSLPLLLAAGALAGTHHLSFFFSLFLCVLAAVAADSIWYALGRIKGIKVLQFFARSRWSPIPVCGAPKAFSPSKARVPFSSRSFFPA